MIAISILLKASVVLSAAALASAAARRRSAATRHLIWTLAVAGVLLLPVLSAVLPAWTAVEWTPVAETRAPLESEATPTIFDAASDAPADAGPVRTPDRAFAIPWVGIAIALYALGVIVLLGRVAAQYLTIHRLTTDATPIHDPEWAELLDECTATLGIRRPVRLLRSLDATMPMAVGTRRPAVLLPAVADMWPDDRRRAVLLHELAHVARFDCLTQTLAAVASALYWIHPGVGWAARRLRVERELACDDRVLAAGENARDYAGHLLDLAYTLGDSAPALAVTMASSNQLEGRMLAVLDAARNRTMPRPGSRLAALAVLVAVLIPIAAATIAVVSSQSLTPSDEMGTWSVRPARDPGRVQVQLSEGRGSYGTTVDVALVNALVPGQLDREGLVQFSIRRDAGAFAFEGVMRKRVGAGTFSFTADPAFADALVKRGFTRPTPAQQRVFARADVGFAYLDELNAQGYRRPDLALLVKAADHDVNLTYLREMGQLGYRLRQLDALINLRDHDVMPQYVRGLAGQGLRNLSPDDLLRVRDHDVSVEYVTELAALGYRGLGTEVLIRLRSHDVMPKYIRELQGLGYRAVPLEELVRLRSHDVMPKYVQEFQALGYRTLSLEELVQLRSHDVEADEVRRANARAGRHLPVDRVIALASNDWRESR